MSSGTTPHLAQRDMEEKMDFATLSKRFSPLAAQDHSTRYEQGDLLVEARPLDSELAKLANEYGYSTVTLKDRMNVSDAFPQGHRIRHTPWTIARALLILTEPEQREAVLSQRPLHEWSVNSIGHAVRRYQEENGLRTKRGTGLGDVLYVEGFGRITVKDGMNGGKNITIEASQNVRGKIRTQDSPNELRISVEAV